MSFSRRRFLEVGSLVAASSAIPVLGANAGVDSLAALSESAGLHKLSFSQAKALVGEKFSVEAGLGRPLQMELVSVDELAHSASQKIAGEAFVLNFRQKLGASLRQGTYQFESRRLGSCALLIVPSGTSVPQYVAVINRRHPA